jgi:hypothetical protein
LFLQEQLKGIIIIMQFAAQDQINIIVSSPQGCLNSARNEKAEEDGARWGLRRPRT